MNYITTKEWLQSVKYIEQEIEALQHEQSRILNRGLVSSPYSLSRFTVMYDNTSERRNVDYAEYSRIIDERIQKLNTLKTDVSNAIEAVVKPVYRILLRERYINGKNFIAISHLLNYSYDHVIRNLHPAALRAVVVPEKYKDKR